MSFVTTPDKVLTTFGASLRVALTVDVNGWNGGGSGESFEEVGVLQDVHCYLEYGIGLSSFHIQETIAFSHWNPFVARQDLLI
ncbi:hypothetical protein Tco_0842642 [Tanacetum coccineum]|uniref:Uncharacterized protein n=1 Tax=Tanacetum coccineum TaxID=301880 RepID=A0ABQ5AZU5_9ASTR